MISIPQESNRSSEESDALLGGQGQGHDFTRSNNSIFSSITAWSQSGRRRESWRPLSWRPLITSRHTLDLVVTVLVLLVIACVISWVGGVENNRNQGNALDRPARHAAFVRAMQILEDRIQGHLVWPTDGIAFVNASHVWNQCFRDQPPAVVVEVANEADVQIIVPFLYDIQRNFSVPFRIRSGGHSYAGLSTIAHGIILSLSGLNHLAFETDDSDGKTATVTVGPAVRSLDILKQIWLKRGYGSVLGLCPNVAEGGYTLGGGQGALTRSHGLAIDNLKAARVVLANGQVVTASTTEHADLFWALRGAGQGNFGVVTELQYTYYPIKDEMVLIRGEIPLYLAPQFLSDFGKLSTPREAGVVFTNTAMADVGVNGLPLTAQFYWNGNYTDQGMIFWNTTFHNLLPQDVTDSFDVGTISTYYVSTQLIPRHEGLRVRAYNGFLYPGQNSADTWQYIITHLWNICQQSAYAATYMEYWGGNSAFNDVAPNATAFYWREAVYNVRLEILMPAYLGSEEFESQLALFESQWVFIEPYLTGTYANYPEVSLKHPSQRTYGKNLPRLQQIKQKYDPRNMFHHPYSIPPLKGRKHTPETVGSMEIGYFP